MKNVTGAKCVKCGKIYPAEPDINTCSCGGILDIEYDYDYIKNSFSKDILSARTERSLFRYRELLPIETGTHLLLSERAVRLFIMRQVWQKNLALENCT